MTHFRSVFAAGALLAASSSFAVNWGFGGAGGNQVDGGIANFDVTVSGTGLIITTVDLAVLAQVTHTWIGDMRVTITHMSSGTSVHLFHYALGDGGAAFGDSSNIGGVNAQGAQQAGNLLFQMGAAQSVEEAANGIGDGVSINDGTYRPTQQTNFGSTGNGVNNVNTNFNVFAGLALDGVWRLTMEDKATPDIGTLGHWELHGTGNPIPEPASFAALGLGALALLRRRRKVA